MAVKVSIIVASFNYEKYIAETLSSIQNQTFTDFEVLVVDDGSKDRSIEIINSFVQSDSRFTLLTHPQNQNCGLQKTMELGLKQASGEWVTFLESDDVWTKDCLEKRFQVLDSQKEVGVLYNDIEPLVMPGADAGWFYSYAPRVFRKVSSSQTPADLSRDIFYENLIPTFSCVMVRKSLLEACQWDTPIARWLDWYLWIQVLQNTKVLFVANKLTYWRLHAKSWNYKKSIVSYYKEYSLFRKKLSQLFTPIFLKAKDRSKIRLINRSAMYFLVLRFIAIVQYEGIGKSIKKVIKRLI